MTDEKIIELFFARDEKVIAVCESKYGKYAYKIAFSILENTEDSDECVNDTWMRLWNSIPPAKPNKLNLFIAKITRNLAFDKYKSHSAKKRGSGNFTVLLGELDECIPSKFNLENEINLNELTNLLNEFLKQSPQKQRVIFLNRYWYGFSVTEIAKKYSVSESLVKSSLFRSRKRLKSFLESEGINV